MPARVRAPRYRRLLERLRQARLEASLTQVAVARQLGKHQSFLSKLESGERAIDPVELEDLARIYRKPMEYFQTIEDTWSGAALVAEKRPRRKPTR